MHDALGHRMKKDYEHRTRNFLPRRTNTIVRLDGKAFHTFTKGFERPFDKTLMSMMDETAKYLCENIQGCKGAYVQSDEISLLMTDFEKPTTDAYFDGNIQKIASITASMATMKFNQMIITNVGILSDKIYRSKDHEERMALGDILSKFKNNHRTKSALFDSRVFTIPSNEEVVNYFIWRQQDATRNSIQMAAQSVCSHKELHKKNTSEQQDMLHEKGINWNDYSVREKRGGFIIKEQYDHVGQDHKGNEVVTTRSRWKADEPPIFTKDRNYILDLMK